MPLLEQQRIQQTLADVATEIEAARLLVWRAAWMGRNGVPMTGGQGSMSKLKAGDVTMWATTTLMDLVGPYAQTTDCPLEKWFRDAKIYQLFEGTAQVQRLVISRMQRAEYQQRLKAEAAEVLEQAPGTPTGDPQRVGARSRLAGVAPLRAPQPAGSHDCRGRATMAAFSFDPARHRRCCWRHGALPARRSRALRGRGLRGAGPGSRPPGTGHRRSRRSGCCRRSTGSARSCCSPTWASTC